MSLSNTPAAERVHIGIFGKRNAGKSSLLNALSGQDLAIVSKKKGTTTDPVVKTMELLPLGPVVLIDTPGLDDEGDLGHKRVEKAVRILAKTDIALLVLDPQDGMDAANRELLARIKERNIPYLIVRNKSDLYDNRSGSGRCADKTRTEQGRTDEKRTELVRTDEKHVDGGSPAPCEENRSSMAADSRTVANPEPDHEISVSAVSGAHIFELKERIAHIADAQKRDRPLVRDLVRPADTVLLVTPIDASAPKGRLILPQQMVIRDLLAADATCLLTKEYTLSGALSSLAHPPALVVTDSQVFKEVADIVPDEIPLTSFSILFARYKGSLSILTQGARLIDTLPAGAHILISEGCTHHRQCEDIGTVKLPRWIGRHTGKEFQYSFTSGTQFEENLSGYDLVIHCGGCMLNEKEMRYRLDRAMEADIPVTNYGTLIAYMNGILERAVRPFLEK